MFWLGQMVVRPQDVTDGLSNTMLTGEAIPKICLWKAWSESNCSVASTSIPMNQMTNLEKNIWHYCYGFQSQHPAGMNSGFAGGSVRFLKTTINQSVWRAISTLAGGDFTSGDCTEPCPMLLWRDIPLMLSYGLFGRTTRFGGTRMLAAFAGLLIGAISGCAESLEPPQDLPGRRQSDLQRTARAQRNDHVSARPRSGVGR